MESFSTVCGQETKGDRKDFNFSCSRCFGLVCTTPSQFSFGLVVLIHVDCAK